MSIIELLEQKKLKKSDFITTENYHIRLTEKAAKLLTERILFNFNRKAVNYKHGRNFIYQNILLDNIQQLSNFVLDKTKTISFRIANVQMARQDSLDIRHKLLLMTPAERKKLGINKATLWYQRKKLLEGNRIGICNQSLTKLR